MAATLLLDVQRWDLVVDVSGNIAVADEPYALAQDAASSIRTFQGGVYYDVTRGVPYFAQILGQTPPLSLLKAKFEQAALLVPGVAAARAYVTGYDSKTRQVTGQVQIRDAAGNISAAGF